MRRQLASSLFLCAALALAACSSTPSSPLADESDWERERPVNVGQAESTLARDGSLFNESFMFTLFEDKRAYRVGDILTVELDERTRSSKSAESTIDRKTELGGSIPLLGNRDVSRFRGELESGQNYKGESGASQENFLSGSITVRVTEVLANGALSIRGEKWIRLNRGDEYIRLQGIVRAEDIDVTNRISSQRIADARITYAGKGDLADGASPGWLTTFFSSYLKLF